ncbi:MULTISPECIES: RNA polymerase sigma-70 factor [Parabacteroides]|jgi:RNA polymerase sigma-70 factor|uniref:RNA polymerase sigma-70 factor (ECF subfamily) n=1 Tax=Parabacteroides faecis TaxID=1217282 RepID=A0ABR6KF88_9BACT|nr:MULTISPECIES: RNA polymerase sigma-70 factor [Parabacteroides]MBB4620165.1 RNA polymerase sigma-70 factor (ECF subfamily) [Parabacteroides faecis]MCS2891049.1 RNA polymerase sigma-70 factor [Parabacteroides faecis]RHR42208.1 RNA polymerase sigma-70 factor [Parabacteroides sp. AF18-52]UVQ45301.1 RNA polymerase sigma-70 factor [Parabacteroides faecis]GGJ95415.1 DNA-directed RNA polymerase sigma-70 factor [Parabacteroides faecis]
MMDTRDELVKLQQGNHKTFECLFKKYYVFLCYEARSYITEKHIVEEIVGDVFRWLWENRETLVITTSIRAYLVRAVHNACLSYLRRNQPEYIELDDNIAERNTLFSLDESPLDYVLSKELIERVGKAVKELPPQYKRVFELSRYKNLSYAEISEEMGVSVNAVKLYQKKALAQLRLVLKEYLPASLD